jgi:hypothetical protein
MIKTLETRLRCDLFELRDNIVEIDNFNIRLDEIKEN